jgi:exonuclease SbcD
MVGLARHDGAPIEDLRGATRRALGNLVDAAIEREVDAVLLAGDLFDGNWNHYATGVHFVKEMGRLREAGIPVVSIAGNHDAESKITKALSLPENVHVLDVKKPETFVLENAGVAVHGQGYATPSVTEDISLSYPQPLEGLINVGLLHTAAGGRAGHANYAPCKLSFLRDHGFDYWGLGHSHTYEVLSQDPPIIFSGNLQGRSIRERGPKGAVLVEFSADGVVFDQLVLDAVRWEVIELDATDCATVEDVAGLARSEMSRAVEGAGGRLLAARVALVGRSEAHQMLLADRDRLLHEMHGAAADVAGERIWIEEVRVETKPAGASSAIGSGAVGELLGELEEILGDEGMLADLGEELRPLTDALPLSLASELAPTDSRFVAGVLRDLSASLPAELLKGECS